MEALMRRALVLEDDLCLKTMLLRIFQVIDPEIEVTWMTTGEQAIDDLNQHHKTTGNPYDLVMADISTPGNKSGLDYWALCRLRFPKMGFLFISAMPVDQFLKTLGSNVLCPPFLPKPFTVGECRQIVEGLLSYAEKEHDPP
jgi:DNA-binding response OmpR family regulator